MGVTSHDVARLAGVSQPTVSRALRGDARGAAATRARARAARQLEYMPDQAGRVLSTRATRQIAPEGNVLAELAGAGTGVLTAVVDLDLVTTVRRHGSFALTGVWRQLREDDPPIPMPLYGGELTAQRWSRTLAHGDDPVP